MNKEFFEKGKAFGECAKELPVFKNLYKKVTILPGDEKFFSSKKAKVLVISEPWCSDCKREIPLIIYIADKAGWEMRIFGRDANPDLMDQYTTNGKRKIPVIVLFDENFKEIGRFIEKPPKSRTTVEVLKEILEKA